MEMDAQTPYWVVGSKVDEAAFCQEFLYTRALCWVDGAFFGVEGRIVDENTLRKEIYDRIAPYILSGLAGKVDSILNALRMECRRERLPHQETVIHVANGTYSLMNGFSTDKQFCRYRLPVRYNPDAPRPVLWEKFLEELLEPMDILTLQEYMGYCLIPTTVGQKMLLITGRGGEGKSRIGVVMKSIFGCNMNLGSLAKVETSPFARADLEHLLVMVDDDLKLEALTQTNHLKSIITAELPMDLERKGQQSYQGNLFVRFLAFGNGTLQALYDRSHGFFRRQIILSAKERDPNRVDDPYLGRRLRDETEGIFLWCLEGLLRLIGQDFRFTISQTSQDNMREAMAQGNNVVEFMASEGYFRFDPQSSISSRGLYEIYTDWCTDNAVSAMPAKSFWGYLRQNAGAYGISFTFNIPQGNGRHVRGFRGIRGCSRF